MISHLDRAFEKGMQRGRAETLRAMLVRQLNARFGPLPEPAQSRIDAASTDELDRWVARVITADSLDGVFEAG